MGTYSPQSERIHYLTLQEAVAEGFGAYSTLRLWIAQGKLPAYKTGKRVKVLREDLEAGLRVKMCVWLGVSRGLDLAFLNAD